MTVTVSPVFGRIVIASDAETALVDTLQAWLPSYLAELERRTGREPGAVPMVRSWRRSNRFYRFPQDQLPAAIVISPGTTGAPERRGDGTIDAWYRLGIAIVCAANTAEATNELAKLYAAAVRTAVLQQPALAGDPSDPHPFAARVVFVGETTDDVPAEYLEIGCTAQVEFDVLVEGIADAAAGPAETTVDAPTDLPVVTSHHIDIEVEDPHG